MRSVQSSLRRIRRPAICAAGMVLVLGAGGSTPAGRDRGADDRGNGARPLTVRDSIESTRLLSTSGTDPVLISPDGKSYLVVLERGDVPRNGTWVELLRGGTATLGAACRTEVIARLFSKSTAQIEDLISNIRWRDGSRHVDFLWDSGYGPPQIFDIDVHTHVRKTLTRSASRIVQYDISNDGQTIVFTAEARHDPSRSSRMERTGFAVTDQSIFSLIQRHFDGCVPWGNYETFVSSPGAVPSKIREAPHKWSSSPELLKLSPDGRYAIAVRPADDVPFGWDSYTQHIFKDYYLPGARQHAGESHLIRRYVIIDVKRNKTWPLWDAPEEPRGRVVWSPGSRRVLVGPTSLPPARADELGLSGRAVADVDVTNGTYVELQTASGGAAFGSRPVDWGSSDIVQLADAVSPDNKPTLSF